jgi:hypothetical protein
MQNKPSCHAEFKDCKACFFSFPFNAPDPDVFVFLFESVDVFEFSSVFSVVDDLLGIFFRTIKGNESGK